jgi:dihydrodiol dehydrogenase / D-xylose 1-dehydrogenase (NADP)
VSYVFGVACLIRIVLEILTQACTDMIASSFLRCPTQVKVTKMTGLGSQQWSEPETYEFDLPKDIVALSTENGEKETPGFNFVNSQGLAYEAAEVNRCFREGLIESPSFPSSQCIEIMRLITDIGKYESS